MKLHYSEILLFFFPLNILITLYHAHNNENKPSITPHDTLTNRSLCECDIQSSIYDKDAEMKSVKENFDRLTSQRFEEYEERMIDKRQKRKEERDKRTQEIIEKDKMEKSLAEKVEKGCLRCGCALGGGVLPVWCLVSGLWYATLSQYVSTTLVKMATDAGIEAGVKVGLAKVTEIVKKILAEQRVLTMPTINVADLMAVGKFNDGVTLHGIFKCISSNIKGLVMADEHQLFSTTVNSMAGKTVRAFNGTYGTYSTAVETAFNNAKAGVLTQGGNATSTLTTAITATVVTIVVIVLILVIIYLILRYRRKKKMKKKLQYKKLLNQ
ncbi:rifin PIR protein, putative [Plasmodium reichenowi]|uniref:Rifin PIR protein, putative n=1 Tax=Plasmodium reichenowi TaxID=5854 RepID=A0A2P9DCD3_PLARE|nr:rifin PIR protein, putative [Plasmodium reichenowi]SOV78709.1 rifin PIR protein, putative [Plasmodium reichenowi]